MNANRCVHSAPQGEAQKRNERSFDAVVEQTPAPAPRISVSQAAGWYREFVSQLNRAGEAEIERALKRA